MLGCGNYASIFTRIADRLYWDNTIMQNFKSTKLNKISIQ